MGTWYTVKVYGVQDEHAGEKLQLAIDTALSKINTSVNTYNPESEISQFNVNVENSVFPVSSDFMRVAKVAEKINTQSQGAFDPTVKRLVELWGFGDNGVDTRPTENELKDVLKHVGFEKLQLNESGIIKNDPFTQLDFAAIAKGYGVDLVLEEIELLGYENILVEIGGEVRVKGTNGNKPWRIGIAVPTADNVGNAQAKGSIELKDLSSFVSPPTTIS
jgi:thiamine biosynthesis lipoprotein